MTSGVKPTRRKGYTRVFSHNQVTLPIESLTEAYVAPGDQLRVVVEGGRIGLVPAEDPWDGIIGSMPGLEHDVSLQVLRDEWER